MFNSKSNLEHHFRLVESAVSALLVLTVGMLVALVTRTEPHPPLEVIPFSLAPFLGAAIAVGMASLLLIRSRHKYAWAAIFVFCVFAIVSFGPQKYFDPAFSRIWPAVICSQISLLIIMVEYISIRRLKSNT